LIPSEQIYERMGKLIRSRRKKLNLTQDDLAQRVTLKRTSITNIEKGRQKIQVHTLFELAAALEVDPVTLIPSPKAQETDAIKERVKGFRPDEREFVKSVLSNKPE
jgi:transcriptional regulator with XRE-family HTH domain